MTIQIDGVGEDFDPGMPCNCPLCGRVVDLNEMAENPSDNAPFGSGELICRVCYEAQVEEETD